MRIAIKNGRYIIFLHSIDCHKMSEEPLHRKINQCRRRIKLISLNICHLWYCLIWMCHLDSMVNKEWQDLRSLLGWNELPWRQSRWSSVSLTSWDTKTTWQVEKETYLWETGIEIMCSGDFFSSPSEVYLEVTGTYLNMKWQSKLHSP